MKDIISQIADLYQSKEFWWFDVIEQDRERLEATIALLIDRKNIFWVKDGDEIVGVCETWKINYETLGKMVCKIDTPLDLVDTTSGNIAYVMNIWVHEDYRKSSAMELMKKRWFELYGDVEYYCGHAKRKSVGMYKTFKVSELSGQIFKGE